MTLNDRVPSGSLPDAYDLEAIVVKEIKCDGITMRLRSPLALTPAFDEPQQLLVIEHDRLRLCVYAPTRELLLEALHADMLALWEEYGRENADVLTVEARRLKSEWAALVEEDGGGPGYPWPIAL